MRTPAAILLAACFLHGADRETRLRPPLWTDADNQPIPKPSVQRASELHAILYNSWCRHLSPEYKALAARRAPALNANAWDEVPDSSWFTNRIGRRPVSFDEVVRGLGAEPPANPPWFVIGDVDEGYTPKLIVRDSRNRQYYVKFDLPDAIERNSGAERVCTLIFFAAGYNVPGNTIAYFRAGDLRLDPKAVYKGPTGKKRPMTADDFQAALARIKPMKDGRYRGLASGLVDGDDLGKFIYTGTRKDDANDRIPHELRRELRGLYVLASWLNHADAGDKNTFDAYVGKDGEGFVKHYLMDFGSTLGSGDFINGPYRVGHEYIFDGPAMGKALITFGIWRRPWERYGAIQYPEIGYYDAELFQPHKWKPNYPNLAFERMDDADAYWGAKIVSAFDDDLLRRIAAAGEYRRAEVTQYLERTLRLRRDAVARHWFEKVTPLEQFAFEKGRLHFLDLAVDRGHAEAADRTYRIRVDGGAAREFHETVVELTDLRMRGKPRPDAYGRTAMARIWIQAKASGGKWSLPVEVVLGHNGQAAVQVLGWRHAAR